jgi:hypothetical protein
MAFTYTVDVQSVPHGGAFKIATGSYTSAGGSAGGDIKTGLAGCMRIFLQPRSAAVVADVPGVNETANTMVIGGTMTIVTTANESGDWLALGN